MPLPLVVSGTLFALASYELAKDALAHPGVRQPAPGLFVFTDKHAKLELHKDGTSSWRWVRTACRTMFEKRNVFVVWGGLVLCESAQQSRIHLNDSRFATMLTMGNSRLFITCEKNLAGFALKYVGLSANVRRTVGVALRLKATSNLRFYWLSGLLTLAEKQLVRRTAERKRGLVRASRDIPRPRPPRPDARTVDIFGNASRGPRGNMFARLKKVYDSFFAGARLRPRQT